MQRTGPDYKTKARTSYIFVPQTLPTRLPLLDNENGIHVRWFKQHDVLYLIYKTQACSRAILVKVFYSLERLESCVWIVEEEAIFSNRRSFGKLLISLMNFDRCEKP